jgi:hypothetical protein
MVSILNFGRVIQRLPKGYQRVMLGHDIFLSPFKVLNSLLFFCSEIDLPLSTSCLEKEVNFYAIINNSTHLIQTTLTT